MAKVYLAEGVVYLSQVPIVEIPERFPVCTKDNLLHAALRHRLDWHWLLALWRILVREQGISLFIALPQSDFVALGACVYDGIFGWVGLVADCMNGSKFEKVEELCVGLLARQQLLYAPDGVGFPWDYSVECGGWDNGWLGYV